MEFTIDIDQMEAGPEMDQWVAEKVMGLTKCFQWLDGGGSPFVVHDVECDAPIKFQCYDAKLGRWTKKYSTDISAAWEVVQKLYDGWQFSLEIYRGEGACSGFFRSRDEFGEIDCFYASAEETKTPLTICRAALKTVRGSK